MLAKSSLYGLSAWLVLTGLNFVSAQNINTPEHFPDPHFRTAVEWFMEVPEGGAFTAPEAAAKTGMLHCAFMEIQDLKGIEFFTGITGLVCCLNAITHLDLSKNAALEWLDCSFNDMVTLVVSPGSQLKVLDCSFNQLTDITHLAPQIAATVDGYADVRYNNLTCDDWETISSLRARLGNPVYEHDPDFDLDFLVSGLAYSPQNGSDLSECETVPPTPSPTASPAPSRTPAPTWTATPTPVMCLTEPVVFELDQPDLAANGWAEIPGGFLPDTPAGTFAFRDFPVNEYPESHDGRGLAVTVQPGQVTFLYALQAIPTGDSPVLLRLYMRASSPGAQVALAALKGYPGLWDGSIGVLLPNNTKQAVNQEFREVLLYQPDREGVLTPAVQVAGLPGEGHTTVYLDRLEIVPVQQPVFSSTGYACASTLPPFPDPVLLHRNDFSQDGLRQNGWAEIPGGFMNMEPGMVQCGDLPAPAFLSSLDGKGIAVSLRAGQVALLYASPAVETQGNPLLLKMKVRVDSPEVALALGALKGELQNADGSIAYQIPATAHAFAPQEREIVILYEPDEGTLVTPIIQAAAAGNAKDIHVWIDSVEIFSLDRAAFAYQTAGPPAPTPTPPPANTPTPADTPASPAFTPTPVPQPTPTPMIPVVVDGAAGGTITLPDQAAVEIPAGFTSSEIHLAFNPVAGPSNLKTEEYAVMSGEYELTLETEGDFNSDLVLVLPVANNEWRDMVDWALAGVQYFDETEGLWKPLGALAEYDPSTNLLTFRLTLPSWEPGAAAAKRLLPSSADVNQTGDPVFLGRTYKRKFRVYIPLIGNEFITSHESSNFKIHYDPRTVKKDAAWSAVGSGAYEDTLVPDYIEDLDKALNEALRGLLALKRDDGSAVFNDPTAGLIGKNTLDVYVRDLGTSDGNSAPRGWLSGRIQIHETRLKHWQEMRGTAAHELCHYLQGDYYSLGGKPAAWFFNNLWFFEATANYYSAVAMNMDPAGKRAYWSDTMAKYLSVPITAPEEASYYTLAHFLDWLETGKYPGEAVVADVMNQRFYNTNDRVNLHTAIQSHSASADTLSSVFQEYGEFILTHPNHPGTEGLNGRIKDSLAADGIAYLSPKEAASRTFHYSSQTGKSSLYMELKRRLDSLSIAYLRLQTKIPDEGLLVARYDRCQGEGLAVTSTLTYAPAGSDDAWYETHEPLDKTWVFTNPLAVKPFGAGGTASFEQAFINRGFADGSPMPANLHCQYYLLLKPEILEIQDGAVLWSTKEIGNIPTDLIAGYEVYRLDSPQATQGVKLNPTPVPYAASQQSFAHASIKKTDPLVVAVRDTLGFHWPEITTADIVIEDITCDSAPVGAMVVISGRGFGTNPSAGQVLLGGKAVTNILYWTDTRVAVQVPDGAKTGPVTVTVLGETSNAYPYGIDESFAAKIDPWKDNISVWVSFYPIVDYSVAISSEFIYENNSGGRITWTNPRPGTISGQAEMDHFSRNSRGEEFKYKSVKITFEDIPLVNWCHCETFDGFFFTTISECDQPTFIRFARSGANPPGVCIEISYYDENGNLTGSYDSAQANDQIELQVNFSNQPVTIQ
ncbi:MAG TPA: IPT/TIG domain-containing protein [bacterium]|nr:IPT/TIG domain-containing protein [bacterium]